MTEPADEDDVLSALRLGWYVAEVRGRNRPGVPAPSETTSLPRRTDYQLPLRAERSADERRIEAQKTLIGLAVKLEVDTEHGTATRRIDDLARQLAEATQSGDEALEKLRWGDLAKKLYQLDSDVQDTLTAVSDTQACAYQLGRGLAECFWALDVEQAEGDSASFESWSFLFGQGRCGELSRLAGRLTAYFPPYSAAVLAGTLSAWHKIASEPGWRKAPDAREALYRQSRRWYEILVLRQDPSSLVKPYAVLRNFRAVAQGLKAFLPQLLVGAASLGALSWFIDLLSNSDGNTVAKSVAGILTALGLTGTGVSTQLKNASQSLTKRLKQDAFSDLAAIYSTEAPSRPGLIAKDGRSADRKAVRAVARAVNDRSLTPATRHVA